MCFLSKLTCSNPLLPCRRWLQASTQPCSAAELSVALLPDLFGNDRAALAKAAADSRRVLGSLLKALQPIGCFAALDHLLEGVPRDVIVQLLDILRKLGLTSYSEFDSLAMANDCYAEGRVSDGADQLTAACVYV